jgi:hypothetical protein
VIDFSYHFAACDPFIGCIEGAPDLFLEKKIPGHQNAAHSFLGGLTWVKIEAPAAISAVMTPIMATRTLEFPNSPVSCVSSGVGVAMIMGMITVGTGVGAAVT